jgi:hypothetical protein
MLSFVFVLVISISPFDVKIFGLENLVTGGENM